MEVTRFDAERLLTGGAVVVPGSSSPPPYRIDSVVPMVAFWSVVGYVGELREWWSRV